MADGTRNDLKQEMETSRLCHLRINAQLSLVSLQRMLQLQTVGVTIYHCGSRLPSRVSEVYVIGSTGSTKRCCFDDSLQGTCRSYSRECSVEYSQKELNRTNHFTHCDRGRVFWPRRYELPKNSPEAKRSVSQAPQPRHGIGHADPADKRRWYDFRTVSVFDIIAVPQGPL